MDFDRKLLRSLDGCSFLSKNEELFSLPAPGPPQADQPISYEVKGAKSTRFRFASDDVEDW
jgi:hypothetical protein